MHLFKSVFICHLLFFCEWYYVLLLIHLGTGGIWGPPSEPINHRGRFMLTTLFLYYQAICLDKDLVGKDLTLSVEWGFPLKSAPDPRVYNWGGWNALFLSFCIVSPLTSIPDPDQG